MTFPLFLLATLKGLCRWLDIFLQLLRRKKIYPYSLYWKKQSRDFYIIINKLDRLQETEKYQWKTSYREDFKKINESLWKVIIIIIDLISLEKRCNRYLAVCFFRWRKKNSELDSSFISLKLFGTKRWVIF